jgi:hypothetical protein
MRLFASTLLLALVSLSACGPSTGPQLLPIDPSEVAVSATLRLSLDVNNPSGVPLEFRVEAPMGLVAFDSVATISGTPAGGELRFTPLAAHVGVHEVQIVIAAPGGGEYDRQPALITVIAADDAAPVFLEPGAGGTYDLTRDPCVRFAIEIRDDDSPSVDIRERTPLPEGAMLVSGGPKSATFDWCPTNDQVAASERWTISLEANDGDHEAVPHNYVVVLRSGGGGCGSGSAPSITLRSPLADERVTSSTGYDVTVSITDDLGLRDAPLLYWSTETPADPPDITAFEQVVFESTGGDSYRARVPPLGLAEGEERTVYYLVSATDNDDATGTTCDHRTDSRVVGFNAVGGAGGVSLNVCSPCSASVECGALGICVPADAGTRCLTACPTNTCTDGLSCVLAVSTEGALEQVCGRVSELCGGSTGSCTEDGNEPNDTTATATLLTGGMTRGQICSMNSDYYRIDATISDQVVVRIAGFSHAAGDLDLQLLESSGTILGSSASTMDSESITFCARDTGPIFARVLGYLTAENPYDLTVTRTADACCVNDAFEPDNSRATARPVVGDGFEGTLCPMDSDHIAIPVTGASRVEIDVTFDSARSDIDIELTGPTGTVIASSRGTSDLETIDTMVTTAGTYVLRVFGFTAESNSYLGQVTVTGSTSCTSTLACPAGQVCSGGTCRSNDCTSVAMCPASHLCPDPGPSTAASDCTATCAISADCRSSEACKWFTEGRACGERGAGSNGAACSSFRDCGVQRACVDWPGGYCARAGCRTNGDCETGTYCVAHMGVNVCALDCTTDTSRCRSPSYSCASVTDRGGASRRVCLP